MTKSENQEIQKLAINCLSAITEMSMFLCSCPDEPRPELKKQEIIQAFVDATQHASVEIQDDAAFALANLAKDCT